MKKIITNSNPFVLLVIPVLFAMIMGVSYQLKQDRNLLSNCTYTKTTSLFNKSVSLFKTICSVTKEKVW
jgi:hypothetical protein